MHGAGARGIRVNAVCPGPVNTPMLPGFLAKAPDEAESVAEVYASRVPLGRVAEPEEIARAVVFLASDASSFITGVACPSTVATRRSETTMRFPTRFGVFYDFRNPTHEPWERRYGQLFEQLRWVDTAGHFDVVSVTEHHFVGDGYSPSTMALATAIGATTSRVGITTNIVQLPLHHPLRIAEDALTADIVSDGRFRLGLAGGYRQVEFEAFGVSTRDRAAAWRRASRSSGGPSPARSSASRGGTGPCPR